MESAFRDAADVSLIETLGWTGQDFPRLALHLGRLSRSAARMGRPCNPAMAEAALRNAAPPGPARMRLLLDAVGRVTVTAADFTPAPAVWRVGLADTRLDPDDPWLTLKSTRRAVYDTARAALPAGLDEVIFLNHRDEVCEGTITSLFFDRGQGWRTPPLQSGLLPGVLRAELLAAGTLREEVLTAADLPLVRLRLGNSLRGLAPAELCPPEI
ncbi:aminotransferase class IV family protein [Szabonella alba]|uniref:aminotransferase class IV family protein n=1 Tax=Szabonella alba TaxID=2804194 RepID=UPI003B5893A5